MQCSNAICVHILGGCVHGDVFICSAKWQNFCKKRDDL